MPTSSEKTLINRRRAKKTGALLVPILERILENEVIPETPDDFRFMDMLVRARALPRRPGVFSPSMLGSCTRQAYFAKRGEKKHKGANSQTNGYFLNGNFVHLKWQFALWRAHTLGMLELVPVPIDHEVEIITGLLRAGKIDGLEASFWINALNFYEDSTRPGVEVRVVVDEDFGGTIDAMVRVPPFKADKPVHVIDFKGINVIDFQRTLKHGAKIEYRRQIVGYGDNVNRSDLPYTVEDCLLVSENKAGPQSSASTSPIALHETRVVIPDHLPDVKRRLRTLRWFDSRNEVPPAECVSTRHMGYQECPFNGHCHEEVLASQRERERRQAKQSRDWKVSRPTR